MKKVLFVFAMLLVLVQSFSQTPAQPAPGKADYLQKSKQQKKLGWVLLVGGLTSTLLGTGAAVGSLMDATSNGSVAADILVTAGVGAMLASIPVFIIAGKNRKKAASLSIGTQSYMYPQYKDFTVKAQPAVTFKVRL